MTGDEEEQSQGRPDSGIVPPYLQRRIEAARRYPRLNEHGPDRNLRLREAFLEGAEWEALRCQTPSTP